MGKNRYYEAKSIAIALAIGMTACTGGEVEFTLDASGKAGDTVKVQYWKPGNRWGTGSETTSEIVTLPWSKTIRYPSNVGGTNFSVSSEPYNVYGPPVGCSISLGGRRLSVSTEAGGAICGVNDAGRRRTGGSWAPYTGTEP